MPTTGCLGCFAVQERWAEHGAELATSRPGAKASAALDANAAGGEPKDSKLAESGGPKRFLPFSTGPRQCANC